MGWGRCGMRTWLWPGSTGSKVKPRMTTNKGVRWLKRLLFSGVLISAAGYGGWCWMQLEDDTPDPRTDKVNRGELAQTVTASVKLSPIVRFQVESQVSRNIK